MSDPTDKAIVEKTQTEELEINGVLLVFIGFYHLSNLCVCVCVFICLF